MDNKYFGYIDYKLQKNQNYVRNFNNNQYRNTSLYYQIYQPTTNNYVYNNILYRRKRDNL